MSEINFVLNWTIDGIFLAISVAALVGAILVMSTRDDAFPAADRQSKWVWAGLLGGSAVAIFTMLPFLSWIGIVITGLYWFDVRPQIKNILGGNYEW
ncbi:MAG: DUF2516 family protein [Corynebacterium sp.]|uniref:DUF2516 family protein n=1 Tax=Corynebacterium sp. TaxID=1720 RepID=UPI0026DBCBE2|nr:DUF2516 family protein [Corynebacterium sp.]MDO5099721.1 DUF2516 family protein [Corynebacterium sp.]